MAKTALLFPGQGAQFPGMVKDFYDAYQETRELFDQASEVLGYDMKKVVFDGESLNITEFTQPAMLTASMAIYQVAKPYLPKIDMTAGLSLGEYASLVMAGCFSFAQVLPLVRKRGLFMQQAVPAGVGGMSAIIGLEEKILQEVVRQAGPDVWMANFNCPGQIVLSGRLGPLAKAKSLATEKGAKMCVDLPLSAPFHTELLSKAADNLANELYAMELTPPQVPILFNVTAERQDDPRTIKDLLKRQVMSPVLFQNTLERMQEMGASTFIEIGPGTSLKSFIKRSTKKTTIVSIDSVEALEKAIIEWTK